MVVKNALPPLLERAHAADAATLDETMLTIARNCLEMRSDDADKFVIASVTEIDGILGIGDAESNGEPRTEEPAHQGPGESAAGTETHE